MNETLFSSRAFIEAWLRGRRGSERVFTIPVRGSGAPREFYAVQKMGRLGLRSILLGLGNLCASPGWDGELDRSTLRGILRVLRSPKSIEFQWNVRFDHVSLATGLIAEKVEFTRDPVHVLELVPSYGEVFAKYSATTRNQVRQAGKRGVEVREAVGTDDVRRYCAVCGKLESQKQGRNNQFAHQASFMTLNHLFNEQTTLDGLVRLLVAEYQGEVVAGGVFFKDGCTVLYRHGAADRDFSHVYPTSAVLDAAIRWACETGASFFNLGGSGIESLARFKSAWGTGLRENWIFSWSNPMWSNVFRLKRALGR